ncbi:MAG: hypothetical protein IT373_14270, partial [Polyangiaceae bacterium]|nr:hypothetical protein [Polyangiaceae bacterium]
MERQSTGDEPEPATRGRAPGAGGVEWTRGERRQRVPGLVAHRAVDIAPLAPVRPPRAATRASAAKNGAAPRSGPSRTVRIVAGLTGVSMGIGTLVGLIHTLRAPTPGTSPFMIAGGLLP